MSLDVTIGRIRSARRRPMGGHRNLGKCSDAGDVRQEAGQNEGKKLHRDDVRLEREA